MRAMCAALLALPFGTPREASDFGVLYLNTANRPERRRHIESVIRQMGLENVSQRVDALQGQQLYESGRMKEECARSLTDSAMERLLNASRAYEYVEGTGLTPGAAALCETTRRMLMRLPSLLPPGAKVALILEDDARLASARRASDVRRLLGHLARSVGAPDEEHGVGPSGRPFPWDVFLLGSHSGETHRGYSWGGISWWVSPEEGLRIGRSAWKAGSGWYPRTRFLAKPINGLFFGLFAWVVHVDAAAMLADAVFPTSIQMDSAFVQASVAGRVRILSLERPLLESVRSSPNNSDIQKLPIRSYCARHRKAWREHRAANLDMSMCDTHRGQREPKREPDAHAHAERAQRSRRFGSPAKEGGPMDRAAFTQQLRKSLSGPAHAGDGSRRGSTHRAAEVPLAGEGAGTTRGVPTSRRSRSQGGTSFGHDEEAEGRPQSQMGLRWALGDSMRQYFRRRHASNGRMMNPQLQTVHRG